MNFTRRENLMEQVQLHRHPLNPESTITGQRLDRFEKPEKNDVFDANDGTWKRVESYLVDVPISTTLYELRMIIRPVEPAA